MRGLMIVRIVLVILLAGALYGLYLVETYPLDGGK